MKAILRAAITVAVSSLSLFAAVSYAGQPDFEKAFQGKDGCFLLYDMKSRRTVVEYNKKRCGERFFACSTFKIPLALMAFDQDILRDENALVKWDGVKHEIDAWNRDQTPKSWLKYSAVWVSQWITPQLGMDKIKRYLKDFRYGNQDMSGGLTQAWLSSTLKISAAEQIRFLERFWMGKLPVSARAVDLVKTSMDMEKSASGAVLHGKTGSGFIGDRNDPVGQRVGWFIGHLARGNEEYIFATNYTGKATSEPAGYAARGITKIVLSELGLF